MVHLGTSPLVVTVEVPMTRPLPKKITFQTPNKHLRVEYEKVTGQNKEYYEGYTDWILWLTANADFTLGSFIKLCYDGSMYLCTIHPDGSQSETEISE